VIYYRVRLAELNRHLFEVRCRLESADPEQRFALPSWIPGSYLLREFARHVVGIRAERAGAEVPIEKIDKSTWSCRGGAGELTIVAEVFALDLSVRGAYLDGRRGYFNGTCLFLAPEGREKEPAEVTIEVPEDARCASWRVATAMPAVAVDERGFGVYRAASYAELIDHPVEISDCAAVEFQAGGRPHRLVVAGRHDTDLERVAADLHQLCETQIAFFGGAAPFESYAFLGLAVGEGYGGLEHRSSCSLIFGRDDLPKPGEPGVPSDYQRFLSLCSHEYFHAWHIKGVKPAAFTPYRLDRRNYTRLLWVFEGITSYYQDLLLLRSDLIGIEAYLERLGRMLSRVYRAPGRLQQSVADASFDAWEKLYKPGPNTANATVSYYSKGALVALALDLTIRDATDSAVSLDRVMHELWRRFSEPDAGLEEGEFEALVEELSGVELKAFFDVAVRGTEDLALAELLAKFAVVLGFRAAAGPDDPGGTAPSPPETAGPGLGVQYRTRDGALELTHVVEGGPAERAGLSPGDHLIALGGLRVEERNLRKRLARHEPGETIRAAAFRGDELLEFPLELAAAPLDTCFLALDPEADPRAQTLREAWLGATHFPGHDD
jgi:predicted metalloprotease with PDZ domain